MKKGRLELRPDVECSVELGEGSHGQIGLSGTTYVVLLIMQSLGTKSYRSPVEQVTSLGQLICRLIGP